MSVQVEIPSMGESVSEVILLEWLKGDGERVEQDEPLCVLETDKANVELPSPASGTLNHLQPADATLAIGAVVAEIAAAEESAAPAPASAVEPAAPEPVLSPAVRRLVEEHELDPAAMEGTGKDGRLTKKDVLAHLETLAAPAEPAPPPVPEPAPPAPEPAPPAPKPAPPPAPAGPDPIRREPLSRLRQRIAEHLVAAQHNAAMLTTFNEIDMSAVMQQRADASRN